MPRHYDDSDEDLYENPYAESDTDADDDDVDVVENPASVVRTARDERLWRMAKASAAKQGRARDWPYVMGIFQHMKQRTGSEPAENPRHDVVSVEVMGRMIVCDVVDMFEGPPRSLPDYAGALVIAKVPEEFSSQAYREGGPYVVGFLLRDGAVFSPTFRPTMAAALRHVEQMPWEQGYSVQHNPDDEDAPPPAPPSFQLRASAVQQGLFAPSSYEAKPQKKKPAAPVDTRQRDLFGLPIDDEPRENPDDLMQRIAARRQAERARREAQLESMHETMAADPGFQQEVRRQRAEATMQRYAAGAQLFKRGDRVVYAGADGAIPASWRGRVIGYEWHPEWDEGGDGHFNIVRWTTPEFETHEGVYHQSDLYRA